MKILGIGVDIVKNSRIKKSINKNRFLEKIYSSKEIKDSKKKRNKVAFFSKRFAAKEAFSKAIGTGISKGINFNEIIVINNSKGKPNIKLIGRTKIIIDKMIKKKFNVLLTLSDDKPFAIATVIISL